jgi:phospholipid/cholesterol/gamma-HCH transport system permease protein
LIKSFRLFLQKLQDYSLFTIDTIKGTKYIRRYSQDIRREMFLIGTRSLKLILFGGLFVGVILAIETGHQLDEFGAKTLVGRTVALGMFRSVGPIIAGLLLAARTGAKNASEIGSMQLSEQIDAMRAFGTNPIHKLVMPRMIAALVMFLPLTLLGDVAGVIGGMLVSKYSLFIDPSFFWNQALTVLEIDDILVGSAKPIFYGFSISTISSYYGYFTRGGTVGLGHNTINAVVVSSASVLVMDFIVANITWSL